MSKYLKEFFFFPDITVMSLIFLTGAGLTFPYAGAGVIWLAIGIGCVTYATAEYFTHRFLYHSEPPKNPFLRNMLSRLHYEHHEYPNDLKLLFLPLWYSLPQFIVMGLVAYGITTNLHQTIAFLTGVSGFFLYYEWKHYIAHRPIKPITPWGKRLKKYHILHHYKNEHYWFGVTSPTYDHLLGTFKDEKEVETSPTARKLLQEQSGEVS